METRPLATLTLLLAACGGEGWGAPTDVAFLADGTPLVSDGYDHARVAALDARRDVARQWGEHGSEDGQLDLPHGVAVDARDRVYVADRRNARVQVFSAAGEHQATWQGPDLGRPFALRVHGDVLWVVDGGDQDPSAPAGRVVALTLDGALIGHVGGPGTGPGQFGDPHGIAVDSKGRVYVAELINRRVQRFRVTLPE
jgi:DNA-binding beta-propeller fold protein YncE